MVLCACNAPRAHKWERPGYGVMLVQLNVRTIFNSVVPSRYTGAKDMRCSVWTMIDYKDREACDRLVKLDGESEHTK